MITIIINIMIMIITIITIIMIIVIIIVIVIMIITLPEENSALRERLALAGPAADRSLYNNLLLHY